MFKIMLALTVAFLLKDGQIIEKRETVILERGFASLEKCRARLKEPSVYKAMRNATDQLEALANSEERRPVVRIGIRAFCLRQPAV